MKKIIFILVTVLLACASCRQDTDDSAETVTNMSGKLSYYPDYGMWGISVSISGTIGSKNLYLIKNYQYPDMPNGIQVGFSGKYYLSDKKSPVAGVEIFYIDITDLTFGWCGSIWPDQEE